MNKIFIYGTSVFAARIYHYIKKENAAEVLGFTQANAFINEQEFCGLPVVAVEKLTSLYAKDSFSILIAVGYSRMNNLRKKIYLECKEGGLHIATFVSNSARVDTEVIGEGCIVLPNTYIGFGCKLGVCNIFEVGVHLPHDCIIGDFNFISVAATLGGYSEITQHCFIGLNSTIKNHTKLAPYTLAGAACNILKNTEENGIYVGNPARIIPGKQSIDAHV